MKELSLSIKVSLFAWGGFLKRKFPNFKNNYKLKKMKIFGNLKKLKVSLMKRKWRSWCSKESLILLIGILVFCSIILILWPKMKKLGFSSFWRNLFWVKLKDFWGRDRILVFLVGNGIMNIKGRFIGLMLKGWLGFLSFLILVPISIIWNCVMNSLMKMLLIHILLGIVLVILCFIWRIWKEGIWVIDGNNFWFIWV